LAASRSPPYQTISTFVGGYPHTGIMRQAFAHEAVLVMEPDADVRAPGAAVAVALCGHWDHEPLDEPAGQDASRHPVR
jgi:hypothetical protein